MACNCNKYAYDYSRIVGLAQRLANVEKITYLVYQKENGSYGFDQEKNIPKGSGIQFKAIPKY